MKRYILFAFIDYYREEGAAKDIKYVAKTLSKAMEIASIFQEEFGFVAQIYDIELEKVIYEATLDKVYIDLTNEDSSN